MISAANPCRFSVKACQKHKSLWLAARTWLIPCCYSTPPSCLFEVHLDRDGAPIHQKMMWLVHKSRLRSRFIQPATSSIYIQRVLGQTISACLSLKPIKQTTLPLRESRSLVLDTDGRKVTGRSIPIAPLVYTNILRCF
jgi:hypothetical protein